MVWRIWVDMGGTFTDCLSVSPNGEVQRLKVLSSGEIRGRASDVAGARVRLDDRLGDLSCCVGMTCAPTESPREDPAQRRVVGARSGALTLDRPWNEAQAASARRAGVVMWAEEEVPILAARVLTGTPVGAALPPIAMRLATTRGTNALLERAGSRVALFTTRGHGDVLRIGTQQRPDLFALRVVIPEPLHDAVVEVDERIDAAGRIVREIDLNAVASEAERLRRDGVTAAAVALMHAWINPSHEREAADVLRSVGFAHVSVSSDIWPSLGLRERASTAVVNAYLSGPMDACLASIRRALAGGTVDVMTSAGGLRRADEFHPKDSLLSGPAGGVIGAAQAGRASGYARVIAFDMGGTSTDVARIDGEPALMFEHAVGGVKLASPAVGVRSVAAGGGSICRCLRGELQVGPRSAGASPGPACYGRGGPMTITDANLLLGRFDPGIVSIPLDIGAALAACEALLRDVREQTGRDLSQSDLLEALIDLADEHMAEAIRAVSIREGYDPAEYALVAFGGAGGQHGCGVASRLGIKTVIVPRDAGLLSARGLGLARLEYIAQRQVLAALDDDGEIVRRVALDLEREAMAGVVSQGARGEQVMIARRLAALRLHGQVTCLDIEFDDPRSLRAVFQARYEAVYGHACPSREIEVESVRVLAREKVDEQDARDADWRDDGGRTVRNHGDEPGQGAQLEACVGRIARAALAPGECIHGPSLIVEAHCTTYLPQGWCAGLDEEGAVVIRPERELVQRVGTSPAAEDLLIARLASIGREMGEQLRRSAVSTNVKERLDYSCAILDSQGVLVVSAPHVPVHLGAMGECVRAVRRLLTMGPGDVVVTNHPAFGGSHLPDVTVISPVFVGEALIAHVASRAHHAEIGGIAPGSMPPDASTLTEEGVVISPMFAIVRGESKVEDVAAILREAPWPSRSVADNLADLQAAIAANERGARQIAALAREAGTDQLVRAMASLLSRAEGRVREVLLALGEGVREASDSMDDGWLLAVRITGGARGVFDFTGTGGVHPRNFNATPAIVTSAIMYVLRLLVREAMPLNEGLTRPVDIIIPPGLLNPDFEDMPAVAAGNTETSQRLVNLMLRALDAAAESQGTMNNVLFGDAAFGYYETLGGGCGAGPGFDGASAVHSHMTNTCITDAEVLEHRCPVRVRRFAIRRGSGGRGRHHGGDGLERDIEFLRPLTLSVISQRRTTGPKGIEGGEDGAPGENLLLRADGPREDLGSAATRDVQTGDRLIVRTPGGGGCG